MYQVDDGNYPPNDDLVSNNAHLDMTEFTVLVTTKTPLHTRL